MAATTSFLCKDRVASDSIELFDGSTVTLRLITPEDRDALLAFHRSLSEKTVYMRYFSPVSFEWRTSQNRLADVLCNDPHHHLTLVGERIGAGSGNREIVGVGRLVMAEDRNEAEFAVTVADHFHGMGIGSAILGKLIELACEEGLSAITGAVLPENRAMISVCRKLGFSILTRPSGEPLQARLELPATPSAPVQMS